MPGLGTSFGRGGSTMPPKDRGYGMTALAAEVISTRLLSLLFGGTRMVGILPQDSYLNIYNEYPRLMVGIAN